MQTMRLVAFVPLVLAIAGGSWVPARAGEERTGLKIGSKAPALKLKDQNGKERTLAELLAKGKVALVFYRSASW
jgi:hypothetical protein